MVKLVDTIGLGPIAARCVGSSPTPGTKTKNKMIYFTKHAQNKFKMLARHNVFITGDQVRQTIEMPDLVDRSRLPLFIAQS